MAKKDTFEKLHALYSAIVDIDRIVNSPNQFDLNGECKLDQILFYVRDIPKKDYPTECTNKIISCIRSSIVDMYGKTLEEINRDIKDINDTNENITEGNEEEIISTQIPVTNPVNMKIPNFISHTSVNKMPLNGINSRGNIKNNVERGTVHAGKSD